MGLLERLSAWASGSSGRREARVLVLGLDYSGKSTVLDAMRPQGTREQYFRGGGVRWNACEAGGGGASRARALWERHYRSADAIIYVVDCADPLRLVVAREELELMLAHPDISGRRVPLLVLANKSDVPQALPPAHIATALGLERISDRPWHVSACCALSGGGVALHDALGWLAGQIHQI